MKFLSFIALILSLLTVSCKTIKFSDLYPDQENEISLLPINYTIVEQSFYSVYPSLTNARGELTIVNLVPQDSPISYSNGSLSSDYQTLPNHLYQDAITIADRFLRANMLNEENPSHGSAALTVAFYDSRNSGVGWKIASVLTLGIPNLFGMPFDGYKTFVELELTIRDCQNHLVKRYLSNAQGKAKVALYNGYSTSGAFRKANISAIKLAMQQLQEKLNLDHEQLLLRLTDCS